jgi:hypothetical protein
VRLDRDVPCQAGPEYTRLLAGLVKKGCLFRSS